MEKRMTHVDMHAALARALIKALGLPQNVTKLTLTMAAGKPVLVECQCMPEADPDGVDSVAAMGGLFELVPARQGDGVTVQCVDDEHPQA